jgi:hypothetical protein
MSNATANDSVSWTNVQLTMTDGTTIAKGIVQLSNELGIVIKVDGTDIDTFFPYSAIQKIEKLG